MKDVETAVRERYGAASKMKEEALCCPVEYDPQYLRVLPIEILEYNLTDLSGEMCGEGGDCC